MFLSNSVDMMKNLLVGISICTSNSKTVYAESMIHTFSKRSEANLSVVILVYRGVVDKKRVK